MSDRSRLVESVFQAAMDLEVGARAAFLSERCGDDASLRAEVESLIAHADQALADGEDFLASPFTAGANDTDVKAGDLVGDRYRLCRVLGEGGLGVVWMAEQAKPVRREVAMKIVKLGMDSKEVIGRFEAERNALSLMEHAGIAHVYDAGLTDRGRPYFVMEYVRGLPITDFCDDERLTTAERLELVIEVCHAVQHAHQKGVIHRDLKPSNVLVAMQGGRAAPKVIDFGIAKATAQKLTERTVFTLEGQLIGTPEYMSPEQAENSAVGVDSTSDIYSLGVILYELLTGTLPFDPESLRQAGLSGISRMIREQDAAKPSTRLSTLGEAVSGVVHRRRTDPRTLARDLRGDLDWIVMKAMEKERTRRYASASELAADIRRHLAHEPVLAGPPSAGYRMRKLARRHRVAATWLAIACLVLVGGIAATATQALRAVRAEGEAQRLAQAEAAAARAAEQKAAEADRERANAVAARDLMIRETANTAMIAEFMLWGFGFANPDVAATVASPGDMTVAEMLDLAVAEVDTRYGDRRDVAAMVQALVADVFLAIEEYQKAIDLYAIACAGLERELGPWSVELIWAKVGMGNAIRETANEPLAQQWEGEAMDIAEHRLRGASPELADATAALRGDAIGAVPPTESVLDERIDAVMTAFAPIAGDDPDGMYAMHTGFIMAAVNNHLMNTHGVFNDATRRLTRTAVDITEGAAWGRHVQWQHLLRWVDVRAYARAGDEDERVRRARRLVAGMNGYYPPGHFFRLDALSMLGDALLQRQRVGDRDEAVRLLVESADAVARMQRSDVAAHPLLPFRIGQCVMRLAGASVGGLHDAPAMRWLDTPAVCAALREHGDALVYPPFLAAAAWSMVRQPGLGDDWYGIGLDLAWRLVEQSPDAASHDETLALALYRTGDAASALALLESIQPDRRSPVGRSVRVMCLARIGDVEGATAELRALRESVVQPTAGSDSAAMIAESEAAVAALVDR